MMPLSALIESRELEVTCAHCRWVGQKPLNWLSTHRDMNCPACDGVIVLNTSARREEILAVRRQVSTLHDQLAETLKTANSAVARPQSKSRAEPPKGELTLLHQFRGNKWPSLNDTGKYRRLTRR